MLVYRYQLDEETNKYIYRDEYECQEDPEYPGEFLQPQYSTLIKPELKEGYITYWEDDQWKEMEDYKTIKFYNKESGSEVSDVKYKDIEKYISNKPTYKFSKYNEETESWEPKVEDYKSFIKSELLSRLENEQKKYADILLEDGSNIEVNCGIESINAINSLIQYLEITKNAEKTINFRLYDNSIKKLTIDDLRTCSERLMDIYQTNLQSKWKIKDDTEKLSTFEEVEIYANENNVIISNN